MTKTVVVFLSLSCHKGTPAVLCCGHWGLRRITGFCCGQGGLCNNSNTSETNACSQTHVWAPNMSFPHGPTCKQSKCKRNLWRRDRQSCLWRHLDTHTHTAGRCVIRSSVSQHDSDLWPTACVHACVYTHASLCPWSQPQWRQQLQIFCLSNSHTHFLLFPFFLYFLLFLSSSQLFLPLNLYPIFLPHPQPIIVALNCIYLLLCPPPSLIPFPLSKRELVAFLIKSKTGL